MNAAQGVGASPYREWPIQLAMRGWTRKPTQKTRYPTAKAREAPAQYVAINTANKTVASVTVETIPAMIEVGDRRPRKTKPATAVKTSSVRRRNCIGG